MIITVAGTPGSGKSTIAKKIAELLGWERFYMGGILRQIANEEGLTIGELMEKGKSDFKYDKLVDDKIVELAITKDEIIIEGRTAFHFAPKSIKLFFAVDKHEGAHRIYLEGNRNEENYETEAEFYAALIKRMEDDTARYMKYYNIDAYDPDNFDIVVDTTGRPISEVLKETIEKLKEKGITF